MRADLAPILLHLLVLIAGLGLLRLAGVVHACGRCERSRPGDWHTLWLGGGVTLSILLLVVGGPFNLATLPVSACCLRSL